MSDQPSHSPFDLPSAKNLSVAKASELFVPTSLYWEMLFSDNPEVVFGTRGSGKTMLLRMMGLQHLKEFAKRSKKAHDALYNNRRYGIFLPLGIDWCVAYGKAGKVGSSLFSSGLNLVACEAFLDTLESLLDIFAEYDGEDVGRDDKEMEIATRLNSIWFEGKINPCRSILQLRHAILAHQYVLMNSFEKHGSAPHETPYANQYSYCYAPLFKPVSDAIRISNLALGLDRDFRWLLCLDELEDLHEEQAKEVLTVFRGSPPNIVIKATTQPYTLTDSSTYYGGKATAVPQKEWVTRRLQYDPGEKEYETLVASILRKRVRSHPDLEAGELGQVMFGEQGFVERAGELEGSRGAEFDEAKVLIETHETNPDSRRKKLPVAAIRVLRRAAEGNARASAYSGWTTIVRVSDGNPGVFIRLLNEMGVDPDTKEISPVVQHQIIRSLADAWHQWSIALYPDGTILHQLIGALGLAFRDRLHNPKTPDAEVEEEVSRFSVDLSNAVSEISEALRVGARHALLVADSTAGSPAYPEGEGLWRLAYSLSARYWLLPRRGRALRLGPLQRRLLTKGPDVSSLILEAPPEGVPSAGTVEDVSL